MERERLYIGTIPTPWRSEPAGSLGGFSAVPSTPRPHLGKTHTLPSVHPVGGGSLAAAPQPPTPPPPPPPPPPPALRPAAVLELRVSRAPRARTTQLSLTRPSCAGGAVGARGGDWAQIGQPTGKLQLKAGELQYTFSRCDTVIVGLHVRVGSYGHAQTRGSQKAVEEKKQQRAAAAQLRNSIQCAPPPGVAAALLPAVMGKTELEQTVDWRSEAAERLRRKFRRKFAEDISPTSCANLLFGPQVLFAPVTAVRRCRRCRRRTAPSTA
jgi:hypothetical protein